MAAGFQFRQVHDDFRLSDEVLVIITDADGNGSPAAIVFWREDPVGIVNEIGPVHAEEALEAAADKARVLRREIVVRLYEDNLWRPHWGILI